MRKLLRRILALALSLLLGVSSGAVITPPAQAAGELAFPTAEGFGKRIATRLIAMAGKQSPFGGLVYLLCTLSYVWNKGCYDV